MTTSADQLASLIGRDASSNLDLLQGTVIAIGSPIRVDSLGRQLSCVALVGVAVGQSVWVLQVGGTNLILGAEAAPTAHPVVAATISGTAFDPTIHQAFDWVGTFVFASGQNLTITLPVTPVGYTGAWAINGDTAANGGQVQGIQGYTATTFVAHLAAANAIPIRMNFGCTYWTAR